VRALPIQDDPEAIRRRVPCPSIDARPPLDGHSTAARPPLARRSTTDEASLRFASRTAP